jgi:hypothetical protein
MTDLSNITNTQISHIIDEYIHSERDRALLKRRFIDGICYEPLAEEFDLSVVQTKRIVYKQGDKVLRRIRGAV